MTKQEVKTILEVLNSTISLGFKYPIGNKDLTVKTRQLESNGVIHYNPMTQQWFKLKKNDIFFRSDD